MVDTGIALYCLFVCFNLQATEDIEMSEIEGPVSERKARGSRKVWRRKRKEEGLQELKKEFKMASYECNACNYYCCYYRMHISFL